LSSPGETQHGKTTAIVVTRATIQPKNISGRMVPSISKCTRAIATSAAAMATRIKVVADDDRAGRPARPQLALVHADADAPAGAYRHDGPRLPSPVSVLLAGGRRVWGVGLDTYFSPGSPFLVVPHG
jgi:hypothetical protein